jgi:hypothetical protein
MNMLHGHEHMNMVSDMGTEIQTDIGIIKDTYTDTEFDTDMDK